jgi:hypothetical protein
VTPRGFRGGVRPEPEFYLPRVLGPKLSAFVVLLVLYLAVCHQLIRCLSPTAVNIGVAHAEAVVMLTVFGEAHTITPLPLAISAMI